MRMLRNLADNAMRHTTSGAITLAAALEGGLDLSGKTVALVASGGNVDAETFARGLAA